MTDAGFISPTDVACLGYPRAPTIRCLPAACANDDIEQEDNIDVLRKFLRERQVAIEINLTHIAFSGPKDALQPARGRSLGLTVVYAHGQAVPRMVQCTERTGSRVSFRIGLPLLDDMNQA
jgi:hypothetical protein